MSEPSATSQPDAQGLEDRNANRSHHPTSTGFKKFVMSQWAPRAELDLTTAASAPFALTRRAALSQRFPGAHLVIPAGTLKTRSNDTDYRFRPHTAFAHLTGLGTDQQPGAVLVMYAVAEGTGEEGTNQEHSNHHAVLYVRPLAPRDNKEFYADARYGEFWVGARPSLADFEALTGLEARHIDDLSESLAQKALADEARLMVITGADEEIEKCVHELRSPVGDNDGNLTDASLVEATSELRLIKDTYEIEQMREAVARTIEGFEAVVRALPAAQKHHRGERVVETTFDGHARLEGNAVGYETIAASGEHATILHWIRNDGEVRSGQVLLLDAGVEVDSLYTADITRSLPVDGKFSEVQRTIYQAVLDASDAAFAIVQPGVTFRNIHTAAMEVIAARLEEWGLLPSGMTAAASLHQEGQQHRRWMVHGTSHHLGLDVHDCAQARNELYLDGVLQPGMVFTIEPGLYFKADDLAVPEEFRGIGVRIEDDVLVTQDGYENLSAALPRRPEDVEAWMASLRHH